MLLTERFFGFEGDISKTQIKNLRKKSCEFISTTFLAELIKRFTEWKAIDDCRVFAHAVNDSDKDPQVIEIDYNSVLDKSDYLPQRVLIEISSRSLMEPCENRDINSILSLTIPNQSFTTDSFSVPTVLPQRTFLEKIFLLHEEFSQETPKIRIERLSRHLYDLEKLMNTEHGISAIQNIELYNSIVSHREKFNALRGMDYSNHIPNKIKIIPPLGIIKEWEKDYQTMSRNMIYGEPLTFESLIKRIRELQERINNIT